MENGIKNKLELFEAGEISTEETIKFLFEYRNNEYFKSMEGNRYSKKLFESDVEIELKCVLIYLLLNYEHLEESWHEKLADFALQNIDLLNDTNNLPTLVVNIDLCIYEYLTSRILNPAYIKSKKWIYLFSIPYDSNRNLASRILKDIKNQTTPFNSFLPYPISSQIAQSLIKKYNYEK